MSIVKCLHGSTNRKGKTDKHKGDSHSPFFVFVLRTSQKQAAGASCLILTNKTKQNSFELSMQNSIVEIDM